MPVLVTGATGFLGGRLAQMLAARGEAVRVLARQERNLHHLAGSRIEVIQASLADTEALEDAVKGVSHIYHCAGCSTDWAPWSVFYEANVAGVRNVLNAAFKVDGLRRLLHVSTTDVYGYPLRPCAESGALNDIGLPYNRTKCLGEQAVWDAHDRGLPITVVRPATIYGPRGTVFATEIAQHLRQGSMAVIDGGRAPGGFCYVDNCGDAILRAASSSNALGKAYNLSDGTGATWRTYVEALAEGLGYRRPWIDIPSVAAFAMARTMEAGYRALRTVRRPPLTRHAVYLLSRSQEYPIARAQRDFGLSPAISLEEGIARTAAWLRPER
jgi:nucleoside-diphosphate-sugar epimerase